MSASRSAEQFIVEISVKKKDLEDILNDESRYFQKLFPTNKDLLQKWLHALIGSLLDLCIEAKDSYQKNKQIKELVSEVLGILGGNQRRLSFTKVHQQKVVKLSENKINISGENINSISNLEKLVPSNNQQQQDEKPLPINPIISEEMKDDDEDIQHVVKVILEKKQYLNMMLLNDKRVRFNGEDFQKQKVIEIMNSCNSAVKNYSLNNPEIRRVIQEVMKFLQDNNAKHSKIFEGQKSTIDQLAASSAANRAPQRPQVTFLSRMGESSIKSATNHGENPLVTLSAINHLLNQIANGGDVKEYAAHIRPAIHLMSRFCMVYDALILKGEGAMNSMEKIQLKQFRDYYFACISYINQTTESSDEKSYTQFYLDCIGGAKKENTIEPEQLLKQKIDSEKNASLQKDLKIGIGKAYLGAYGSDVGFFDRFKRKHISDWTKEGEGILNGLVTDHVVQAREEKQPKDQMKIQGSAPLVPVPVLTRFQAEEGSVHPGMTSGSALHLEGGEGERMTMTFVGEKEEGAEEQEEGSCPNPRRH